MPKNSSTPGLSGWREPLWEKQRFEAPKQFIAFRIYRGLPQYHRTFHAVLETLGARSSFSYDDIVKLSVEHYWSDRVGHFDMHACSQHANLVQQKKEEIQGRQLHMLGMAGELLKLDLHNHLAQLRTASSEGANLPVFKISELTRLLDVQLKLERLVHGESTENVSTSGFVGEAPDYTVLSDTELEAIVAIEAKAIAAKNKAHTGGVLH